MTALWRLATLGLKFFGSLLLGLVAFAAGYALYAFLLLSGAEARRSAASQETDRLRGELSKLEVTAARLEEFRRAVESQHEQLRVLALILPEDPAAEAVAEAIRRVGTKRDLVVTRVSAGQGQKHDVYATLPIAIEARGRLDGLLRFAGGLARLPRLVIVDGVVIERGSGSFRATFQARAFWAPAGRKEIP